MIVCLNFIKILHGGGMFELSKPRTSSGSQSYGVLKCRSCSIRTIKPSYGRQSILKRTLILNIPFVQTHLQMGYSGLELPFNYSWKRELYLDNFLVIWTQCPLKGEYRIYCYHRSSEEFEKLLLVIDMVELVYLDPDIKRSHHFMISNVKLSILKLANRLYKNKHCILE